jgi:ABC-2 type transport system ATP-binding protein
LSPLPETDPTPALEIQGIAFSYASRAVLQDVSIRVPVGAFCVLLGVNGAGKTTLFSLLTRLFLCRQGSIRILGRNLNSDGRRALAELGVVFQQPTLDLDLSVRQNLRYFCVLQGLDPALAQTRIEQALREIGLIDRGGDKVRQLSGGQRRRLELARALLHQPRLLLADEPTVGLDIHSRQAILQQVRAECHQRGIGVLWATHLVDEVQPDDEVVVLHEGRVLMQGTAQAMMHSTSTETVGDAFNRLTRGEPA